MDLGHLWVPVSYVFPGGFITCLVRKKCFQDDLFVRGAPGYEH